METRRTQTPPNRAAGRSAEAAASGRAKRAFVAPVLEMHEKLPEITGIISTPPGCIPGRPCP